MKMKTTTAVLLMTAMAIAVAYGEESRSLPGSSSGGSEWKALAASVNTPKGICAKIRHHTRYLEDLDDHWQSGAETWAKRTGDCEDFAIAIVELCKAKGFAAKMYVVYPKDGWEGHAVVIGVHDGKMWMSSNGWFEKVDSLDEAGKSVSKEMGWRKEVIVKTVEELKGERLLASTK